MPQLQYRKDDSGFTERDMGVAQACACCSASIAGRRVGTATSNRSQSKIVGLTPVQFHNVHWNSHLAAPKLAFQQLSVLIFPLLDAAFSAARTNASLSVDGAAANAYWIIP